MQLQLVVGTIVDFLSALEQNCALRRFAPNVVSDVLLHVEGALGSRLLFGHRALMKLFGVVGQSFSRLWPRILLQNTTAFGHYLFCRGFFNI